MTRSANIQGLTQMVPSVFAGAGYVLDQATKYPAIVRAGGGGDGAGVSQG